MQKTVNHFVRAKLHYTDSGVAKGGHGCMPPPPSQLEISIFSGFWGPRLPPGLCLWISLGDFRPLLSPRSKFLATLPYTDTGYEHPLRTPATNTTNGQTHNNSTTNLLHRNATRAQHLDMSRCWDVANFCQLVVSVGGVRIRYLLQITG